MYLNKAFQHTIYHFFILPNQHIIDVKKQCTILWGVQMFQKLLDYTEREQKIYIALSRTVNE